MQTLERAIAVPYAFQDDVLRVAVADPGNLHAIDELRLSTRHTLELGVSSREDILAELRRLLRAAEAVGIALAEEAAEEGDGGDDLEVDDGISDGPLVRLVNAIIFQAAEETASDVHFEPQEDVLLVRFRVDGVLREVQRVPKRMAAGVTTRLKVLAKLDIAERRKPQDGRITLSSAAVGRLLDIRVATPPTVEGEKVVVAQGHGEGPIRLRLSTHRPRSARVQWRRRGMAPRSIRLPQAEVTRARAGTTHKRRSHRAPVSLLLISRQPPLPRQPRHSCGRSALR